MKSEKDFDDFIKNKFSAESNFPFEEDKWARMEEMIIASEEKKKRRGFLWIFFSGFITALFFVIPFIWYLISSSEVKNDRKLKAKNTPPNTNKKLEITKDIDDSKKIANPKITNPKIENEKDLNQNSLTNNEKSFVSKEGNLSKNKKNKIKENKKGWITKENQKKIDLALEVNPNLGVGPSTTVFCGPNEKDLKSDTIQKNKEFSISRIDTLQKEVLADAEKDSLSDLREKSNEIDLLPKKNLDLPFSKFSFYGALGTQYNFGFSQNDGNSFSPSISAAIQYNFSPVWSIISGMEYSQVANLNFKKEIVEKSYDFGYRNKITTLSQEKNHYFTFPIAISRKWNKNNVAFGLNPAVLVANKSNVSSNEKNSLSETEMKSISSYKYGYGLSQFD